MAEIDREYAAALFALAEEQGALKETAQSLQLATRLFAQNPGYLALLSFPGLSAETRKQLLFQAFQNGVSDLVLFFLAVLTEKERIACLPGCADEFFAMQQEKEKQGKAKVKTAFPLTETEKQRLARLLSEKTGKEMQLVCQIDPALLGGVQVEWEDMQIDASAKRRLEEMRKEIAK